MIQKISALRRSIIDLRRAKRRLRFDVLEDRRLLAGIEVFLFNDVDGSRTYDPSHDVPLINKAVYVDLNRNGQFDSSEAWSTTDASGVARFQGLSAGDYAVRLLGNNQSIQQTLPTQFSDQGVWAGNVGEDSVGEVVHVDTTGNVWAYSGSELTLREVGTFQKIKSIDFGTSTILDAVVLGTNPDTETGFVLTQGIDQSRQLWRISAAGTGSKSLALIDVSNTTHLTKFGDGVLVTSSDDAIVIAKSSANDAITNTGLAGLPLTAQIKDLGNDRIAALETGEGSTRLTVYRLTESGPEVIGRRLFSSNVQSWDVVSTSDQLVVQTAGDILVLSPQVGLPVVTVLTGANGPVLFDSTRGLLISGSSSTPSQLLTWNATNWSSGDTIPVSGDSLAVSSLKIDSLGKYFVGAANGRAYQIDLAVASVATVRVETDGTSQVQIGVRLLRDNQVPTLGTLEGLNGDEDQSISVLSSKFVQNSSDPDGDRLVYVVTSRPKFGSIALDETGAGSYQPDANKFGDESVIVQAYDGRDWSLPQVLSLVVNPVDDLPTDIFSSVEKIDENPGMRTTLGVFTVQDVDGTSDYEYRVDDPRFSILDGALKLVSGAIDFEKEPLLVLAVLASDRNHIQDVIARTFTLSVTDKNDPPTGMIVPINASVPENTSNVVIGNVSVIDQDANSSYVWSVSDSRFRVVDGKLVLGSGGKLDYETQSSIALTIHATDGTNSIDRMLALTVTDQDDAPQDITLQLNGVAEKTPGAIVGSIGVVDQDVGEVYAISVSDSRFEVVRGSIRLKPNTSVEYVEPGFIDLIFTATSQRNGAQIQKQGRLNVIKDSTPHHNDLNPFDVDGDGTVSPLDPLIIINYINKVGVGPVVEGEGEGGFPDIDVDGDGAITPLDVLILINHLNKIDNALGEDDEDAGGEPPAEGEGPAIVPSSRLAAAPIAVPPLSHSELSPNIPSASPTPVPADKFLPHLRSTDLSLANYFADSADEMMMRKSRRR